MGSSASLPDCRRADTLPTFPGFPFPFLPLCFEGLGFPSLSLAYFFALVGGLRIAGTLGLGWLPLAAGISWLACGDWLPSENGPKTFLKKSLARAGKAVSMYTK
jgi:hypothetical protein